MKIETISDFRRAMRYGPYAWPGGYPMFFWLADGEPLSFKGAKACRRAILEALRDRPKVPSMNSYMGDLCWRPVELAVNWEDPDLICVDTNERIPSAYAEPD